MNKLIRNELYKIFHKKSTYFFLFALVALLFAFGSLVNYEIKTIEDDSYSTQIEMLESDINELKNKKDLSDNEKSEYISDLARLDMFKLLKERNYPNMGSEFSYVQGTLLNYFIVKHSVEINKTDYLILGYESKEDFDKKFNDALKVLDNFVPLDEVKKELNNLKKETVCESVSSAICDEYFEAYKRVLQYRIDNNIPYAEINSNSVYLSIYISKLPSYLEAKRNYDKLSKDEKEAYREALATVKICEYKMDNKLISGLGSNLNDYSEYVAMPITDLAFIIIFGVLIVASSIVSDEFDKGTIKQLLIKPFSRSKIVLSKIIACLITALFFILFAEVAHIAISFILLKGFNLTDSTIIYDYSIDKVITLTGLQVFGYNLLAKSFYFILFALMIIFISTLTRNTALSAASGFFILILPEFLAMFIQKFKYIAYLPFYTWKLNDYLFGGVSQYGVLDFKASLAMDIIYVIVFVVLILITFKHSEVKNQ